MNRGNAMERQRSVDLRRSGFIRRATVTTATGVLAAALAAAPFGFDSGTFLPLDKAVLAKDGGGGAMAAEKRLWKRRRQWRAGTAAATVVAAAMRRRRHAIGPDSSMDTPMAAAGAGRGNVGIEAPDTRNGTGKRPRVIEPVQQCRIEGIGPEPAGAAKGVTSATETATDPDQTQTRRDPAPRSDDAP